MSSGNLFIGLRGQIGLWMDQGPPNSGAQAHMHRYPGINCRCLAFSSDGLLLAYSDSKKVMVLHAESFKEMCTIDQPQVAALTFSPKTNFLATWCQFRGAAEGNRPENNLHIHLLNSFPPGRLVKGFIQKTLSGWKPQWTQDEKLCARIVNSEVHFYEDSNFNKVAQKLVLQNIQDFQLPPMGKAPYHVAAYVPCTKGQPAFARIFQYPNFANPQCALAQKSFYKADRVDLIWSPPGRALLIVAASEVSADSYYGEQSLHYIDVKGEACLVPRSKNGPVYCCEWAPDGKQYCVVYGYMPARASLFNLKSEVVFDFGTGPRNIAYYNPFGNILCLAGFGNLQGNLEFWDVEAKKLIKQTQARDTTHFEWAPDGQHALTATLAPRLRVGNGYKIWKYTGDVLHHAESDYEVWEAHWQPCPKDTFAPFTIQSAKGGGGSVQALGASDGPKRYVPPAMRGRPEAEQQKSKYREEYEPPSNAKEKKEEPMSKSAMRNKKRREAKKAQTEGGGASQASANQSKAPAGQAQAASNQQQESPTQLKPSTNQEPEAVDPETDKKIKGLKKKLKQIEKLREREAAGEKLELNQKEKIESETSLVEELEYLTLNPTLR